MARLAARAALVVLLGWLAVALLMVDPIAMGWIALLGTTFTLGWAAGMTFSRAADAQKLMRDVQKYLGRPDDPPESLGVG